jgi:hypothetical protein
MRSRQSLPRARPIAAPHRTSGCAVRWGAAIAACDHERISPANAGSDDGLGLEARRIEVLAQRRHQALREGRY